MSRQMALNVPCNNTFYISWFRPLTHVSKNGQLRQRTRVWVSLEKAALKRTSVTGGNPSLHFSYHLLACLIFRSQTVSQIGNLITSKKDLCDNE